MSPKTSKRFLHSSRLALDSSRIVRSAPARAKLIESVPRPQPISRTFLPFHVANSANAGMCGSTKYFRASTSSKYWRVPTYAVE